MIEIIIPAYNCATTLQRTLISLTTQTSHNFIVTLIDDCSTQDIYSIVEQYKLKLPISYIRNEERQGVGMTRQRGINETKSEYITFLDADDILLPTAIEEWSNEINKSSPDVIYCPFIYVWEGSWSVPPHFGKCHGKVYKTAFLKAYDIKESSQVKCNDDVYLNWQAFDLANKVSLLTAPQYIQIYTKGSVTNSSDFYFKAIDDAKVAKQLAIKQITKFKKNALSNYKLIEKQAEIIIYKQNNKYIKMFKEIKHQLLIDDINL